MHPHLNRRRRIHSHLLIILVVFLCLSQSSRVLAEEEALAEETGPHGHQEENASEEELIQEVHVTREEREDHAHSRQETQEEERTEESANPQDEQGSDEEEEEEARHYSGLSKDANGIWPLESYENFAQVLKKDVRDRPHGLLLVLLYTQSESCKADHDPWRTKLEEAAVFVREHVTSEDIHFGSLDTAQWEGAAEWLAGIGVETTPTFVFIVARNFDKHKNKGTSHAFLLDYIGPLETAEDVGNTVLQYYTRLFLTSTTPTTFRPFPNLPDDFAALVVPRQFPSMDQVRGFWESSPSELSIQIAKSVENKVGGVSKYWSQSDNHFIKWLMNGAERESQPASPSITMFVQCQEGDDLMDFVEQEFVTFSEMAWILSSRRDVWFVGITQICPANTEPGQVAAYRILEEKGWEVPVAVSKDEEDLSRFLIHHSTPAVLWFDRYATAPIAFADDYKVHLLLMVNVHPLSNEVERYSEELQQVVQDFHRHCDDIKQDTDNNNAICLIVPSTETRILTTFGVDFWSPLDAHIRSDSKEPPPPTFPTLLITDRRPQEKQYRDGITTTTHAVLRYLLRPVEIFQEHAVTQFTRDFWNHELLPELRSIPWKEGDVRVNKFGVTTLNAVEFQQRFQTMATTHEHALVLFTHPSCGHCKRFHNIYNEASKILRDIQWDSHMALYKVEVSQSNEVHWIPLPWLPDVYYFPPNSTPTSTDENDPSQSLPIAPVRYDITDQFGNGVGRLSDPLELIEWWLDVMIGEGNWMDPNVLLKILDDKEDA